jgi:DNA repair exonuclease SbcCD ATPase subunit
VEDEAMTIQADDAQTDVTDQLRQQLAEADAARRHAQEVSSELVKEKRELEAQLATANGRLLTATQLIIHTSGSSGEECLESAIGRIASQLDARDRECVRLRGDMVQRFKTIDQLSSDVTTLRELVGQFIEAWDHDGEPNAAAYEDVVAKARHILNAAPTHSETIASVTAWADETFGLATIDRQILRAEMEFQELLHISQTNTGKIAEEAADVVICLYRMIGTLDPEAINKKMAKNRAYKWKVDGQGCAQHVGEQ